MFLDKKIKNQYTIGKVFRKEKGLRKPDPHANVVQMPTQLKQYIDELISNGLEIKNLAFAMFKTRNGLSYPGLIATDRIKANTILVKVPVDCLLTTRDGFLSEINKIFIENAGYYGKQFSSDWEDRILLTYLLYEYQKGKKSKWFNLIRNLPKDIDYAIFWKEDEVAFLEDESIINHIQTEKNKFMKDTQQLLTILSKYPEFFHPSTLKKENVIWLHTHLVTRCFGKYFEYTTMVPFAELFNHQCTDVYYSMYYRPGNPHDEHEQFYEQKQLTEEEMNECNSSDGSYDAQDFEQQNEEIECQTEGVSLEDFYKVKNAEVLQNIKNIRIHMFSFINFSDSISLCYIINLLGELRNVAQLELPEAKKKCEQLHSTNVKYIKKIKQFYNKINRKYYTYGVRQKKKKKENNKKEQVPQKEGEEYFRKSWPKDKFDKFYMLCSTKDQFQKGSQVFFCYGRLPNKLLLMRYGIALEHNKYDHMFIRINVEKNVLENKDLRNALGQIKINRNKRFKLKRTKICMELLAYLRSERWQYGQRLESIFVVDDCDKEIQILQEVKEFYHTLLSKYSKTLKENEKKLEDKTVGYHKYFGLVYKVEQQRIIMNQIQMIDYALQIIGEIKGGQKLKEVLMGEKSGEKLTMQIMMEGYLRTFEVGK